jgi:drug/metabolite transporter (DMT)-like permease
MFLVILAALCVAAFGVLFKSFESYRIALRPAISVNYLVAFITGLMVSTPWNDGDLTLLYGPSFALGALFACMFLLLGISSQRAGVARTTIAGRMSLVLTVLITARIFREDPGMLGWAGIALSIVGLVLTNWQAEGSAVRKAWLLPLVILVGSALCDVGVTIVQRTHTTSMNEASLPTLCFASAALVSTGLALYNGDGREFRHWRVWFAGSLLGIVNYASLLLLVTALSSAGLPASVVFPLMNIAAMLFSIVASLSLFKERITAPQWTGVGICVCALVLIMLA